MEALWTFLAVFVLTIAQSSAEEAGCRRPRPLRQGRYEYASSADLDSPRLPVGYVVRVVCRPGAELRGEEFITCEHNGVWSHKSWCKAPTVCYQNPTRPTNGYVRMRGMSAGSVARYGCNPGFQIHGRQYTVCNETTLTRWSGETPLCIRPPTCPPPTNTPENMTTALVGNTGHLIDGLYTDQSTLKYQCTTGHFTSNDVIMTCQSGTWISEGDIPQCLEITCRPPTLEPMLNGHHNIEYRDYGVGDVILYECDYGYVVDGRSWQVCMENGALEGVWSDTVPSCKVAKCPDTGSAHLDGGYVYYQLPEGASNPDQTHGPWPVGTVMVLRCSSHLELLGSSERVCQSDGNWNGTLASCDSEENFCPALGNPIHGFKVRPFSFDQNGRVRFQCLPGYEMLGSEERTCSLVGEWTGEMPRCMSRDEFDGLDRITSGLGRTFDEIAIDGSLLAYQDGVNSASGLGRNRRSIDLSSSSGVDIYFAFDSSRSIGNRNFNVSKEFAKKLVDKVFVSTARGGARVGAMYYSTTPSIAFHVNQFNTSLAVKNAIDQQVKYQNEGTNLPAALRLIKSNMLSQGDLDVGAAGNRRVLFIMTDGMNNMGGEPIRYARSLKEEHGFAIHCIGFSRNVDKTGLAAVASLPHSEHVFFLQDYTELNQAVDIITGRNTSSYDECGVPGTSLLSLDRTVGGTEVKRGAWPWQVALYNITEYGETFFCGGSLIDRNWILTAAHCFNNVSGDATVIYLGVTNRDVDLKSSRSQRLLVSELIKHAAYNGTTFYNDIALLKLDRPAVLNPYVRTVCLPKTKRAAWFLSSLRMGIVTGWGHTGRRDAFSSGAGIIFSPKLNEIHVPIVDDPKCVRIMARNAQYENREPVKINTNSQFCAGNTMGTDACTGDSGGPLVVRRKGGAYFEVGIVSFGFGCGLHNVYGVYTRVPDFEAWINERIYV